MRSRSNASTSSEVMVERCTRNTPRCGSSISRSCSCIGFILVKIASIVKEFDLVSDCIVGIDMGGTCTDCVVIDGDGRIGLGKAFTTPPQYFDGIGGALAMSAAALGMTARELLARTRLFLHSTTVAENAVVDGALATAGLLTTRGFEDTLFATRGGYGRWSGLTDDEKRNPIETDKLQPIVPRGLIRGIRERTDAHGTVFAVPADA